MADHNSRPEEKGGEHKCEKKALAIRKIECLLGQQRLQPDSGTIQKVLSIVNDTCAELVDFGQRVTEPQVLRAIAEAVAHTTKLKALALRHTGMRAAECVAIVPCSYSLLHVVDVQ